MSKLYAPIIEGTIPAFYTDENKNIDVGTVITVPFSMNRGVSQSQVSGFSLKIKTIQNSTYLYTWDSASSFEIGNNSYAKFIVPEDIINKLKVGQCYKIQLAYISGYTTDELKTEFQSINLYNYKDCYTTTKDTEIFKTYFTNLAESGHIILSQIGVGKMLSVIKNCAIYSGNEDTWYYKIIETLNIDSRAIGYYSSVGIIKYTTKPQVYIKNLTNTIINNNSYVYTGVYSQENNDVTERVYSYKFDVYAPDGTLYKTSGIKLHNSSQDTNNYESYDQFEFQEELEENEAYLIQYSITTINKMEISSYKYKITKKTSIDPEIKANLVVTSNFENGYINLKLEGIKNDAGLETPARGSFLITRSSSDSNFTFWDEVCYFKLSMQYPSRNIQKDFTVEQGKTYQYALQQYNDNGIYSNRLYSNKIYADFEYAFLFDGIRQLKIKYNPKITSFKNTVLESKVDTIGGKYPFVLRNGNVNYKEFPISGLISYKMDDEKLFLTEEEQNNEINSTNLTGENISAERYFKLKVLDWLTNGETKLFRSPTEGNYIVNLLNTSLSPNDTLGRMLHTFSCTADEIAEYNYNNLSNYGFLSLEEQTDELMQWETVDLAAHLGTGKVLFAKGQLNTYPAYTVQFDGMMPGAKITLIFDSSLGDDSKQEIVIGSTGSYYLDAGIKIEKICIPDDITDTRGYQGTMTYSYYTKAKSTFDEVENITVQEIPIEQFIGSSTEELDIINSINNIKNSLVKFNLLNFRLRDIVTIYFNNDNYYEDSNYIYQITDFDDYVIYKVYTNNTSYYYYDYHNSSIISSDDFIYNSCIQFNDNLIDLKDIMTYQITEPGQISNLKIGNGVMAECCYQVLIKTYNLETEDDDIVIAKSLYEAEQSKLESLLTTCSDDSINALTNDDITNIITYRKNIISYYNDFITLLTTKYNEKE